ncbi:hypothetical protein ACIGEP_07915 [Microbacterium sp. NPDC077663]|uniref:hypothetical protein n=1 Tax=Microbacterium sp. NPDC077663 TaxID=3364189 RepID=UPI0037CC0321
MARRSPVRRGLPSVVVAVLLVALTVAVGGLVVLALQRGQGTTTERVADPLPVVSPSPSVTASSAPPVVAAPGSAERFLAVGDGVIWRATAGICGDTAPVVERSVDEGATWTDETPTYREIGQVRSLLPFADTQATLVADVGDDCDIQALQTFTDGAFWSPYEEVLAKTAYLADDTVVIDGTSLSAPCAQPWGLRASGDTVAFVCDGTAYETVAGQTTRLADGVVALDVHDGAVVAATVTPDCDGLQLSTLSTAGNAEAIACTDADPASPIALALTDDAIWLWKGDALTSTPR